MNVLLLLGVALQGCLAAFMWIAYPDIGVVGVLLESFTLVGLALMAAKRSRSWGARLVMVASCPFVPLGFLTMYGAVRELDRLSEERFQGELQ